MAVGAVDATTGETLEPKLLCSLPHIPVELYYGWLHQVGWVATWIAVTFPWLLQMFLAVGGFFAIYLICRPRLLGRLLFEGLYMLWHLLLSSGGELVDELDEFVFSFVTGRRSFFASTATTTAVPNVLAMAQSLANSNADPVTNNQSVAEALAAVAALGAKLALDAQSSTRMNEGGLATHVVSTPAQAGSGLCVIITITMLLAKAGRSMGF